MLKRGSTFSVLRAVRDDHVCCKCGQSIKIDDCYILEINGWPLPIGRKTMREYCKKCARGKF